MTEVIKYLKTQVPDSTLGLVCPSGSPKAGSGTPDTPGAGQQPVPPPGQGEPDRPRQSAQAHGPRRQQALGGAAPQGGRHRPQTEGRWTDGWTEARAGSVVCEVDLSLHPHQHFTSQREEFEGTRENMLVWLTELDLQLTNVEHFSESDVHHKIQRLNVSLQRGSAPFTCRYGPSQVSCCLRRASRRRSP